ncbi:MAG: glycosyltransferase family 4 protein, partial [Woeseia sp.]|nr:glycosyltransferase family 4 protein [Woeseia sp.]
IVENLPSPFDRRVWQEATTLHKNGYQVAIICPKGKGYEDSYQHLDGVHIYRHWLPPEANGAFGYLLEYSAALTFEFFLALKIAFKHGFDVIHACNPPDNIFIVAGFFRLFGKRFLFDHHDITPELYEAKFGRKDFFYKMMLMWERLTFRLADVSIATNESYREIAISRGKMPPEKVFVVRSGPDLTRLQILPPAARYKCGRKYLVGYVGVMGAQEGLDHLLRIVRTIVFDRGRDDIHFCLVGGGTELAKLKNYAQELDVSDHVTFTGRVDDQTLLEVLNTAEVCVNPDVPSEMNNKSTMNKIMEYMSLAKPIVQYDLDEGRRSALDASLYAEHNNEEDFANKILQLLDDSALRDRMGRFGRNRVQDELEWKHEIPKLLAAYDTLFSR